jgi:hypothetical protein
MAEENRPIFIGWGLRVSFAELWPQLKRWN